MDSIFESQRKTVYKNPETLIYERKFDTAIRMSQLQGFRIRHSTNTQTIDDQVITNTGLWKHTDIEDIHYNETCYPKLLLWCLHQSKRSRTIFPASQKITSECSQLAYDNILLQSGHMLQSVKLPSSNKILAKLFMMNQHKDIPNELAMLLGMATFWGTVIEQIPQIDAFRKMSVDDYFDASSKVNNATLKSCNIKVAWSKRLMIIRLPTGEVFVLPRVYILLIHNKLCDLISVLLNAFAGEGISHCQDMYNVTVSFTKELCHLAIGQRQHFFTIIKTLEALCVSMTLREVDAWDNREYFDQIRDELLTEANYDIETSQLYQIMLAVDIPSRHELSCMSKMVGHPLVNMHAGAKSIHKKTTEVYDLNYKYIKECECHIKINYIRNSVARDGKWPPCSLTSSLIHPALTHACLRNKDPFHLSITSKYGTPSTLDFMQIDLLPNMKFCKLEAAIPYLKDKTISLMRTRVIQKYLTKESERDSNGKTSWRETRLLLFFLLNPSAVVDHVKYLDKYTESATLEELSDYLVLRIVPKEKELKVNFRGFGCKTYEDRMRCLAQEKSVMTYLDKYCDEQAMTLNELDLARRLLAFRRLNKAYTNHYILNIVLDASSWNTRFRDATVDGPCAETLDKIFGYPIFSKTHRAYQNTLVYVPDDKQTYWWDGQEGGIEGLNQDTWVVVYIAMIKVALDALGYKHHILCKGDDFRVVICLDKGSVSALDLPKIKNRIVAVISKVAKQLGHIIKVEESYGSEKYFAFSKEASVDDIMLPQTFRKIPKAHANNNCFLPFLDSMVSATLSNAHSACKTHPIVIPCEYVGLFWLYYYLVTHPLYKTLSKDEILGLSLVPSMSGGFPIIYHHNMYVRAESDLFPPFLSLYKYVCKKNQTAGQVMANFMQYNATPPTTFERIYKDPYALHNHTPALPDSILRDTMHKALVKITKNEEVRRLLDAASSQDSQMGIDAMDSCNILAPRVFSTIYAAMPRGVLSEILAKFESARSVVQAIITAYGYWHTKRLLRRLMAAEVKLQTWRCRMAKGLVNYDSYLYLLLNTDCPTHAAQKIRELCWGKRIEGITMPPVQHIMSVCPIVPEYITPHNVNNHFTFKVQYPKTSLTLDRRAHYSSGAQRPFVGYKTRSGTVEPTVHFIDKNPILLKLRNVLDLISWVDVEGIDQTTGEFISSNLRLLIEKLVFLYSNKTLDELAPFTGRKKSGTLHHHLRGQKYRESIVPNVLANVYTQIQGESDSHVTLTTTSQHYTINFLHIYCHAIACIFNELEVQPYYTVPQDLWVVTTDCEYCMTPIYETPLVVDANLVQNICYNPLITTTIDEYATTIMKESLDVFNTRVYNVKGATQEITIELASRGICQELVEMTMRTNEILESRYITHPLTHEGREVMMSFLPKNRQRDVGYSEIKRIPTQILASCLVSTIYHAVHRLVPWAVGDNLYAQMAVIPPSSLPWASLTKVLHTSGRLHDVILYLCTSTYTNLSMNYVDATSCNSLLVKLSMGVLEKEILTPTIVILSNYADDIVDRHLSRELYLHKKKYYQMNLHPHIKRRGLCKSEDEQKMLLIGFIFLLTQLGEEDDLPDNAQWIESKRMNIQVFMKTTLEQLFETIEETDEEFLNEILTLDAKRYMNKYQITLFDVWILWDCHKESVMEYLVNIFRLWDIDVTVTTLSNCISTIRGQQLGSLVDRPIRTKNIYDVMEGSVGSIQVKPYLGIKVNSCTRDGCVLDIQSFYRHCNGYKTSAVAIMHIEYASRPFGYTNCSPSTLVWILQTMGLVKKLHAKPFRAACVADGIGGCSSVLLNLMRGGWLFYSTLTDECGYNFKPIGLSDIAEYKRSTLHFSSIKTGLNDLSMEATITYIVQTCGKVDILVCDYESKRSLFKVDAVYKNMTRLFLLLRRPTSIFIMKISHEFKELVLHMLHVLGEYCMDVHMLHPPTLKCHLVSYIVAQGVKKHYLMEDNIASPYEMYHPGITVPYMKFHNLQMNRIAVKQDYKNQTPIMPPVPSVGQEMMQFLPVHFCSLMSAHMGIDLKEWEVADCFVNDGEYITDLSIVLENVIKATNLIEYIQTYNRQLKDNTQHKTIVNQAVDLNTQAHRHYIVRHLMRVYGCLQGLSQMKRDVTNIHNQYLWRRNFVDILGELPERDKPPSGVIGKFNKRCVFEEVDYSFFTEYLLGLHIALTVYAYYRMKCQHIASITDKTYKYTDD